MIESLKDLERLLKLCRKQGVTELTHKDVSFKLGDISDHKPQENALDAIPDDGLSNEELMFYSAGAMPADDVKDVQ